MILVLFEKFSPGRSGLFSSRPISTASVLESFEAFRAPASPHGDAL
jgi:hypothetical protein